MEGVLQEIDQLKFESTSAIKQEKELTALLNTSLQKANHHLNNNLEENKKYETILTNLLKRNHLNFDENEIKHLNDSCQKIISLNKEWNHYAQELKHIYEMFRDFGNNQDFDSEAIDEINNKIESIKDSLSNIQELIHDVNVKYNLENDPEIDEFLK